MSTELLQQAHEMGFLRAAEWAGRDDLLADTKSPAYLRERDFDVSSLASPQPQPEPAIALVICKNTGKPCQYKGASCTCLLPNFQGEKPEQEPAESLTQKLVEIAEEVESARFINNEQAIISDGLVIAARSVLAAIAQPAEDSSDIRYVPINTKDYIKHPNDKTLPNAACSAALDERGDDKGQGLDPYWKWGFRQGFDAAQAAIAQPDYTAAYYEICSLLGLSAMSITPSTAHSSVVIPALKRLIMDATPVQPVELQIVMAERDVCASSMSRFKRNVEELAALYEASFSHTVFRDSWRDFVKQVSKLPEGQP